jgi:hypothetical protein
MTKRFALVGFVSVVVLGLLITGLTLAAQAPQRGEGQRGQGQRGPATPPAPCGPNIAGDLGKNTAKNSRCFELRMYTVDPSRDGVGQFKGGINELHQRFREKEVELFKKNGAEVLGVWQNVTQPTLVYMLAFRDRVHRDAVWAAFNSDPEWNALRMKYNVPLQPPNVTLLSAADYSPLK